MQLHSGRSISLPPSHPTILCSLLIPHAVSHRFVGVELHEPKREKGVNTWDIREVGQGAGTFVSTVQPELRMRVVKDILGNNGYFGAKADYELIYNKRNPKKARIKYRIEVPEKEGLYARYHRITGSNESGNSVYRQYK